MACCAASYYCRTTPLPLRSLFLPRRDGQLVDGLSCVAVGLGQALLCQQFGCPIASKTAPSKPIVGCLLVSYMPLGKLLWHFWSIYSPVTAHLKR